MRRYRYTGEAPALVPSLHREVQPGEVIETDQEINNPNFVPVDGPKRAKEE